MTEVTTKWYPTSQQLRRCHKCGKAVNNGFYVNTGGTTGYFCNETCFMLAKAEMEQALKNKDEHSLSQSKGYGN